MGIGKAVKFIQTKPVLLLCLFRYGTPRCLVKPPNHTTKISPFLLTCCLLCLSLGLLSLPLSNAGTMTMSLGASLADTHHTLILAFKSWFYYIYFVYVRTCGGTCILMCTWKSEHNLWEPILSSMYILGMVFRLSGLVAGAFTHWANFLSEWTFLLSLFVTVWGKAVKARGPERVSFLTLLGLIHNWDMTKNIVHQQYSFSSEIYTIASGEQSQLRPQSLGQKDGSAVRTLLYKPDNPNLIPGPPVEVRGENWLHSVFQCPHRCCGLHTLQPYHILVN